MFQDESVLLFDDDMTRRAKEKGHFFFYSCMQGVVKYVRMLKPVTQRGVEIFF